MFKKVELFIIWCALTCTYVDTSAFITCHLTEVAKTTHQNVISVECTMTVTAKALNRSGKFGFFDPHFLGVVVINIATLTHTTIINTEGDTYK